MSQLLKLVGHGQSRTSCPEGAGLQPTEGTALPYCTPQCVGAVEGNRTLLILVDSEMHSQSATTALLAIPRRIKLRSPDGQSRIITNIRWDHVVWSG